MSCGRLVRTGAMRSGLAVLAFFAFLGLDGGPAAGAETPNGAVAGLKPKFVDVAGVKTRYYEAGQGEPLVLVHGDGWTGYSSANIWSKNIPGLSQRFHVFAVDKLGSGMTGNPPDDKSYNLEGEVEHMYQFLLAMKLGKAHLVGQARGGSLVLFLAAQHADVVASITIINSTNAAPPVGETGRGAALSACPTGRTVEEWKCRLRFTSTAPDVTFDEEFWEAGTFMSDLPKSKEATQKIANGAGEPLNGRFPQTLEALHSRIRAGSAVQMPVFLYWGVEDPNNVPGFPPAKAGLALYDIVAAENPRARMLLANRSGHCHFREHPEEFNANLTNFIVNVASK